MEDLELFINEVEQDEELLKIVNEAKNLDEICKIAKSYGYYISIEDFENYYIQQVSGGRLVDNSSHIRNIKRKYE